MNKEFKYKKTFIVILLITIVAAIALSATYAKYVSKITATSNGVIAKWDIDFEGNGTAQTTDFTVDLAKTMTPTADFIQPGSSGSFNVVVTNNGDVPSKISANLADQSSTLFKKGQFTISLAGDASGADVVIAPSASKTLTVNWNWDYEMTDNASDADDTSIGTASTQTAETLCTVTLTATQVDPNAA